MSSDFYHGFIPSFEEPEIILYPCDSCSKTFVKRRSLSQHRRRVHVQKNRFQCAHCDYAVQQKHDLVKHLQRLHLKNSPYRPPKTYSCVLCDDHVSKNRKGVIDHYVAHHDLELEEQLLTFPSAVKFEQWKSTVEQSDVCQFVHSQGPKNRSGYRVQYLRCFRNGNFRSASKGLRRLKSKGSNKINGVCPASMKVVEDTTTGHVDVSYVANHVGHSQEMERLNFTKEEKVEIATMLAEHQFEGPLYKTTVIQPMDGELSESVGGSPVRRVRVATKKDLWNIRRSFGLDKNCKGSPQNVHFDTKEIAAEPFSQESELVRFYNAQSASLSTPDDEEIVDGLNEKKQKIRNIVEHILEKVSSSEDVERVLNALTPIAPAIGSSPASSQTKRLANAVIIMQ